MKQNIFQTWCLKHSTVHLTELAQQPEYKDYFFNTFYEIAAKAKNVHSLFEALKKENPNFHYIKESEKSIVIWEHSKHPPRDIDFKPRTFARIEFR